MHGLGVAVEAGNKLGDVVNLMERGGIDADEDDAGSGAARWAARAAAVPASVGAPGFAGSSSFDNSAVRSMYVTGVRSDLSRKWTPSPVPRSGNSVAMTTIRVPLPL